MTHCKWDIFHRFSPWNLLNSQSIKQRTTITSRKEIQNLEYLQYITCFPHYLKVEHPYETSYKPNRLKIKIIPHFPKVWVLLLHFYKKSVSKMLVSITTYKKGKEARSITLIRKKKQFETVSSPDVVFWR